MAKLTKDEQLKIVADLLESIKQKLLSQHERWPEEWDGIDLRVLIAIAVEYDCGLKDLRRRFGAKRVRDAQNEITVRNLT